MKRASPRWEQDVGGMVALAVRKGERSSLGKRCEEKAPHTWK